MLTEKFKSRRQSLSQLAPGLGFMKQSGGQGGYLTFSPGNSVLGFWIATAVRGVETRLKH